jgi:hypothetical protein
MSEEPKKIKTFECKCGAILASKQGLGRHLNSRKHKILIGEIIVPPKVKAPPKQRGRKLSPDSPENITKILNSRVDTLTPEELNIRRAYFRKRQSAYMDRKRSV